MADPGGTETVRGHPTAPQVGAPLVVEGRTAYKASPLELAFQIGGLLNELVWHLSQAAIVGSKVHEASATKVLVTLEIMLTGLFPEERGGEARRTAGRMREEWDGITESEGFSNDWAESYAEANESPDERHRQDLLSALDCYIPDFGDELRRIIRRNLEKAPKMWMALQLGSCIDEGLRNPNLREHLIVKRRTRAWRAWRHRRDHAEPGTSVGRRDIIPPRFRLAPKSRKPGELKPPQGWYEEVRVFWDILRFPTAPPSPEATGLEEPTERRQFHEQLVRDARESLSRTADDDWRQEPSEEVWPPNDEWHFRENQFAFMKRIGNLNGNLLKLLKALAKARYPSDNADLVKRVWGDDAVVGGYEKKNLRVHISKLRGMLRKTFQLPLDSNPIPIRSDGVQGWLIDTQLIRNNLNSIKP